MAAEVYQFTVTIPAGTTKAAPAIVDTPLYGFDIESVDLEVPPGPAGLMGFYLAISGEQWVPHSAGEWLVWDDQQKSWSITDQPTSEGWQVVGYNADVFDHEVVVRYHVVAAASPGYGGAVPSLTIIQSAPPPALVTL